jgi:hypothetical protein
MSSTAQPLAGQKTREKARRCKPKLLLQTKVAVGGFSQELGLVFLGDVLLNMDVADISLVLLNLACEFNRES